MSVLIAKTLDLLFAALLVEVVWAVVITGALFVVVSAGAKVC
jgi:hypothetical protein